MTAPRLPKPFTAKLASEQLSEVDLAVAVLWFHTHEADHQEVAARDLADDMISSRLKGSVNISRLTTRLGSHPDVVRGRGRGTFRIRATADARLTDKYAAHRKPDAIQVQDTILPDTIDLGGRRHLEALRREINGSYEFGFYNGCAVVARRLVEALLIEVFDRAGALPHITDAKGNLVGLAEMIAVLKGSKIVPLSRGAPKTLGRVKETGDTAAHSRYYTTSQRDIEDLNPGFRHVVTELAAHAGLTRSKP